MRLLCAGIHIKATRVCVEFAPIWKRSACGTHAFQSYRRSARINTAHSDSPCGHKRTHPQGMPRTTRADGSKCICSNSFQSQHVPPQRPHFWITPARAAALPKRSKHMSAMCAWFSIGSTRVHTIYYSIVHVCSTRSRSNVCYFRAGNLWDTASCVCAHAFVLYGVGGAYCTPIHTSTHNLFIGSASLCMCVRVCVCVCDTLLCVLQ